MNLIDTHCHLDVFETEELDGVLQRAKEAGVERFVTVGIGRGIEGPRWAVRLADQKPEVYASVGVHPHDAVPGYTDYLHELEELARHPKVVAIGETGLDFFREWSPFDLQRESFRRSIDLALSVKKPLIIHCREAETETLEIIRSSGASRIGGVFHCYSGSFELAAELASLNFLVSLTGIVTFKSAHELREVAGKLPADGFMLETDCPYMAPEPYRGKRSEPMHVRIIAEKVAQVRGISVKELAQVTTKTAERFFGLTSSDSCG